MTGFLALPLEALIAMGFVAGMVSTLLFRIQGLGCFWLSVFPILASVIAGFEFSYIPQDDLNSTASLAIVFAGIWVGAGLIFGHIAGLVIKQRRNQNIDV